MRKLAIKVHSPARCKTIFEYCDAFFMKTPLWLYPLLTELNEHADPKQAKPMAIYMRGQFEFLGIPTPLRRELAKDAFKASMKVERATLWRAVMALIARPHRECHYIALDMLDCNVERLEREDLERMLALIDYRAWWDSVDSLRKPIGLWLKAHPEFARETVEHLLAQKSFWQRRVAITLQLGWKEETLTDLLELAIVQNLNDPEFFIQKGIGWALRDYAKTNPDWVRGLFARHAFSTLALREGGKYLEG